MKKKIKKNQMIITVLAILLAITGYINYLSSVKNTPKKPESNTDEIVSNDLGDEIIEPGDTVLTSSTTIESMVAKVKLEREQTRAKSKETLFEIIDNTQIAEANKKDAINKVIELSNIAEKEIAAEILLEAKGFSNAIVSLNSEGVDVIIDAQTISDADRAQIVDIIVRKTEVPVEKVVITPVSETK